MVIAMRDYIVVIVCAEFVKMKGKMEIDVRLLCEYNIIHILVNIRLNEETIDG